MNVSPDRRRAELAKIHILVKQLRLDDAAYRDVLWAVARVDSAKDLDEHGRGRVIEQLQSRVPQTDRYQRPGTERTMLRKVRELLGDRPAEYAMGILAHMFGSAAPARLEWASDAQLHKLIAALQYDRRRHEPKPPEATH